MKLLMFYALEFWFKPHEKAIPEAPNLKEMKETHNGSVVVFYHAEAEDMGREEKIIVKFVKNIKWLSGKFGANTVVLHSFNHLSTSKAPFETAFAIVPKVRERLERAAFSVFETPFGYQNEWQIHVSGESLAKVFRDL